MELHTAIRGILKMQGQDFATNPGFINALEDFNAFEQNPAFKNVFRIIVSDGYMGKLLGIGAWNLKAQGISEEIVRLYAVDKFICSYIIESLAYGLGFTSETPQFKASQGAPATPPPAPPKASKLDKTQKELAKMDEDDLIQYAHDAQDYLDNIIEIKGDWKRELGPSYLISSDFDVDCDGENQIQFRIEINGHLSIRDYSWIEYIAVLYDHRGKIIGRIDASQFKNSSKSFQVLETHSVDNRSYKTVSNIERIVFYWEQH